MFVLIEISLIQKILNVFVTSNVWINDEIKTLGKENFFHADYDATLTDTYGADYKETLVVEGGEVKKS